MNNKVLKEVHEIQQIRKNWIIWVVEFNERFTAFLKIKRETIFIFLPKLRKLFQN